MTKEIVFVTGRDPAHGKGGGSSYVRTHARAALRAGFEPHVFCVEERDVVAEKDFGFVHYVKSPFLPRRTLKVSPEERPERFIAHWLSAFSATPHLVMAHGPWMAASIEKFLSNRSGPYLIHSFYTWGCVGLTVRERFIRKGVETVVVNSVYTTADHEAQAKARGVANCGSLRQRAVYQAERLWIEHIVSRYERLAYRKSQLVLYNYDSVAQLFLAKHGPVAETRKLRYSAETAFLHDDLSDGQPDGAAEGVPEQIASLQPHDAPLIVSVSRHDPRKGLDVLIRALANLRARNIRFRACLVSGGPLFATHQRLIEGLGLADVATLTGWVSDSYSYLRHADIFALPSLQEGSGSISLLEALQAGAAIVASDLDGIPEDVINEESALLTEPGNVEALSHALERVLTDVKLRERLRRRARETFIERFSADAFIKSLSDAYAEMGFKTSDA
jgi:glycosyltransferase involved in cell wall biosynthesis